MNLCDYLKPDLIVIEPRPLSKEVFFNELIEKLCKLDSIPEIEAVKSAVWNREKEGRTVLENGLAIPHARYSGIQEIKVAFGVLPSGYEDLEDKVRVKWVYLFLSPQDQFRNHLQMLACISRVFQDKSLLDQLLMSNNAQEAFDYIQSKERAILSS